MQEQVEVQEQEQITEAPVQENIIESINNRVFGNSIAENHTRFKDADWYEYLKKEQIILGGSGGINSWVALFLSRIGSSLHIYDPDTYEEVNMAGQFVSENYVGSDKVIAIKKLIREFSGYDSQYKVSTYCRKFTEDSLSSRIMIAGFDNMKARSDMFNVWKNNINPNEAEQYLFIDGRLLAQSYQIFVIQGNRPEQIAKYEQEYLFSDAEVAPVSCTLKQTTHAAAGIASHMVGFVANFATNKSLGADICNIPFLFEYITEPNFIKNEYV